MVIVLLLSSATSSIESRPLRNDDLRSHMSFRLASNHQVSKAAKLQKELEEYAKQSKYERKPTRISPGGPDPHHHFLNN